MTSRASRLREMPADSYHAWHQRLTATLHFESLTARLRTHLSWTRAGAIVLSALIGASAAVAIGKTLTPVYSASAQVYVDPRALQLPDQDQTSRPQDVSSIDVLVESQMRLITSGNVLWQVIRDAHLDSDPEFAGASEIGQHSPDSAQTAAVEALSRRIRVERPEHGSTLGIEVSSADPAKAVMLANALCDAFLAESRKAQAVAARRATGDLSVRLGELQERLRSAENALAAYKTENNLSERDQNTLLNDHQLSESDQRLAAARALALDAQARYDRIEAGVTPLQSTTIADLRAQYGAARDRYAQLKNELGPRHPALRYMETRVEGLRRMINDEVERLAEAAKSEMLRSREYEALLGKAIETQKRRSAERDQTSPRLRELERDVEASNDAYQSFLKRTQAIDEQQSLTPSIARQIGEATLQERRSFPPAMSLLAGLGFMIGAFAASGWIAGAGPVSSDAGEPETLDPEPQMPAPVAEPVPEDQPWQQATVVSMEKPVIARLQESDVARTPAGILAIDALPDLTRVGWPTLQAALPLRAFLKKVGDIRAAVARRSPADKTPVLAVIGMESGEDRSIAALNVALAAARHGDRVLLVDSDHGRRALSNKLGGPRRGRASRLGWLGSRSKPSHTVKTANGISVLPLDIQSGTRASVVIRRAIARLQSAGSYDLVILDGPAMPWGGADRKLLGVADGIVAILPVSHSLTDSVQDIIAALDGAERKLIGILLNELTPAAVNERRLKQSA